MRHSARSKGPVVSMTFAKLRGARERKRRETGTKVEGRKRIAEWKGGAEIVELARRLRRKRPKGGVRSYREIASALFEAGHKTRRTVRFRRARSGRCCAEGGSWPRRSAPSARGKSLPMIGILGTRPAAICEANAGSASRSTTIP